MILARKTFISYKFSEAREVRDRIIEALGEDAVYYNGENGFSPDMSGDTDEKIWGYLKEMIWGTSVTIVVVSPEMRQSNWIESEISYSLRKVDRGGVTSLRNGVVAVIMKVNGSYDWFKEVVTNEDGCSVSRYKEEKVCDIIRQNRWNQKPRAYACTCCKTVSWDKGSYISYVEEDSFLDAPGRYIELAFDKSQDAETSYELNVAPKKD